MMTENPLLPPVGEGEHPFAPYVRILGRGKRGSRSYTQAEAKAAMAMILRDEVEPVQLGAFLMLLRVKEETAEELAGFIEAVREAAEPPADFSVDLDWSSYAGKRRHAPWFLFAVQLLADAGVRVFIHGAEGHSSGRVYTTDILRALGHKPAQNWSEAKAEVDTNGFCYMPLKAFSPKLAEIINLRPILGLRSPVHSLARLINPLSAPTVLQGIFHPPYAPLHQNAAALLGYRRTAVIRGEGGEIEASPDNKLRVFRTETFAQDEPLIEEQFWPAMFARRHVKPDEISADHMQAVWRGTTHDEYGEAAVQLTTALALYETGRCSSQEAALQRAGELWEKRNKAQFGALPG
ncbi:glycosyl transferase family protein [Hydrocarboniclastica marina]|nr:glycosyl transferase family protein [Hydrocarboniclastica marina]